MDEQVYLIGIGRSGDEVFAITIAIDTAAWDKKIYLVCNINYINLGD